MIKIAPSILSADFARLADEIARAEEGGADWLHLDVMDGHFVPNITFGPPLVECVRRCTKRFLDAHLMITHPEKYAADFVKAGADLISFQLEAAPNPGPVIDAVRKAGAKVSMVVNPNTPAEPLREWLPRLDMVLVMSVYPGFGGQKFIPGVLPKLRKLRAWAGEGFDLEIDGGISPETVGAAAAAGANVLVAGSAVFKAPDIGKAISDLRSGAENAARA